MAKMKKRPSRKQASPGGYDTGLHVISEERALEFLIGRGSHPDDLTVKVGDIEIGGDQRTMIAGPCAVDDERSFLRTVEFLASRGVRLIRANLYKFRTFTGSFQGLGEQGVRALRLARERFGVSILSEVLDTSQIEALLPVVDMFQVGSRSMTNTALLKALGGVGKPVLLKRFYAATLGELMAAADYLACSGNYNVILCERGIRSFDPWTRFTLDAAGIALLRRACALPVVADISHSLGRTDVALPIARAALAAGANGLMVEVHNDPGRAKSDAPQQMSHDQFDLLLRGLEGFSA